MKFIKRHSPAGRMLIVLMSGILFPIAPLVLLRKGFLHSLELIFICLYLSALIIVLVISGNSIVDSVFFCNLLSVVYLSGYALSFKDEIGQHAKERVAFYIIWAGIVIINALFPILAIAQTMLSADEIVVWNSHGISIFVSGQYSMTVSILLLIWHLFVIGSFVSHKFNNFDM